MASREIAQFLQMRAQALVQNQPDILGFLLGTVRPSFGAAVTQGAGNFSLHSGGYPVWISASGSYSTSPASSLTYGLATLGGHVSLGEMTIAGVMVQYDIADQLSTRGIRTRGEGWLAGPYYATRLGEQPLYFEARALYGRSTNRISPLGTFADTFSGDRWLFLAKLTGQYDLPDLTLLPALSVSHVTDGQEAYVDGLGNLVPAQSVAMTDISLGLGFETPLPVSHGTLTLTGGLSGTWSELRGNGAASAFVTRTSGVRARIDAGLRYDSGTGINIRFGTFLDGIGAFNGVMVYGADLAMVVEF